MLRSMRRSADVCVKGKERVQLYLLSNYVWIVASLQQISTGNMKMVGI